MKKMALAIHGGAGTIIRSLMTRELEAEYREGLKTALEAGWSILRDGGSALDTVEAVVVELENFHLFNAGKGSVFTHAGKNEMDAAIMDGKDLNAGAVAFVKNVKNPVKLARLVMDRTPHILLGGDGADEFARQMGVEVETDEYFFTEHRHKQLLQAMEDDRVQLDHSMVEKKQTAGADEIQNPKSKIQNGKSLGTVGAVACDSAGNIAAATSTGGMTNKKFGRIGDTAIIGSGTYAENATCAVSCTGHGEYFMLGATAYDVAARMKYLGVDLEQAAAGSIGYLTKIGGEGGLIAVDAVGNISMPFNSEGMYRGFAVEGETEIDIYREEFS
jgi:beta-aspartyl-peptidase (threonine type)